MTTVDVEGALSTEFLTVEAVLATNASTSRTDAFVLTWVKMEKQMRRIFCFLVYQNPAFTTNDLDGLEEIFVSQRNLNFRTLIKCINELGPQSIEAIVGNEWQRYLGEISRIRKIRNKILHGQNTGQNMTARELEKEIDMLRSWVANLARNSQAAIGYDGIARNTFIRAKNSPIAPKKSYPFADVTEFRKWLNGVLDNDSNIVC